MSSVFEFLADREILFAVLLESVWSSPAFRHDQGIWLEEDGGVGIVGELRLLDSLGRDGQPRRLIRIELSSFPSEDHDRDDIRSVWDWFGVTQNQPSEGSSVVSVEVHDAFPEGLMVVGWLAAQPWLSSSLLVKTERGYRAYTREHGWLTGGASKRRRPPL